LFYSKCAVSQRVSCGDFKRAVAPSVAAGADGKGFISFRQGCRVCSAFLISDVVMNRLFLYAAVLLISTCLSPAQEPDVIPRPVQMMAKPNVFAIDEHTTIASEFTFRDAGRYFAERLRAASGLPLGESKVSEFRRNVIALRLDQSGRISPEGYTIEVGNDEVTVRAADVDGAFYGVQTLLQLLPVEVFGRPRPKPKPSGARKRLRPTELADTGNLTGVHWDIPRVMVADAPHWAWRGVMLDVSSHFFGKETVMRLLDWMALHKLNRLHLRLTGDAGWRFEVKKYPALAKSGATGSASDPQAMAQYYTRADIGEIVAHAAARHIVVVPEISLPGHAGAAIRACPELDGGFNTLNPAREQTWHFVEAVLTEAMELFPSQWIHFGGGEVYRAKWNTDADVLQKMKAEGLSDTREVESWFARRVAAFIKERGRTPVGWDAIAESGVDPASVVCWSQEDRPEALKAALAKGHPVILSPRSPCFFDYPQDPLYPKDKSGICNTIEAVYRGPRIPADIPAAQIPQILGAEACVWTGRISTEAYLQFNLVPRLFAFAEMAWSPPERRDYDSFMARARSFVPLYEMLRLRYYDADNPVESLRKASLGEPDAAEKLPRPPSAEQPARQ
jgi:hexosaminidase